MHRIIIKMQIFKQLVVLGTVLGFAIGLDLPSDFKKCKISEENIDECLRVAIEDALPKLKNGLPTLGFPPLKPLKVPSMTIGEGTGTVHVVQNYNNVNIYGLSEAKIEKAKFTITSNKLDIDVFVPELKLEADYDLNGRILVLPITGTGKCTILLKNLKAQVLLSGETFDKKDKKYLEMKDVKLTLKPETVEFNFENLFNGDEKLGAEMNKVLNENWKALFEDVGPGYEESIAIIIKNVANIIFKKIPVNDVFLE